MPAIFGSEVFPSPVLEQIGKEAGVKYVDVLRDDDLPGEPGDPEHSWMGLMHFDYVTMTEAMGGDASALKAFEPGDVAPDTASTRNEPGRADREELLGLAGVTCGYGSEAVLVDVDLAIHRGEFIGIVGPSGAGKTTALRVLVGSMRVGARQRDRAAPACGWPTCRRSRRSTGASR